MIHNHANEADKTENRQEFRYSRDRHRISRNPSFNINQANWGINRSP